MCIMEDTWKSQAQNKEMSFSQVAIGLSIAIYLCLDAVYLMLFICSLEHNLVVVEYLLGELLLLLLQQRSSM